MTLELLREFCYVARLQNITKAAELLYTSQSTLSRHIADLESALGVQLIRRNNREFALTEAGQFFYAETQKMLENFDNVKIQVQKISAGRIGQLNISSFNPYLPYVFEKIQHFRATHPEVSCSIKYESHTTVESLLSGKSDLGLTFDFEIPESKDLCTYPIGRDDICLLVPPSHPLAASSSVALSSIRNETLLMLPPRRYPLIADLTHKLLYREGDRTFAQNKAAEEDNLETMIMRVRLGDGITLLPRIVAQERAGGCILLGISDCDINYNICMVWRADNQNQALRQFLQSFDGIE